MVCFQPDYWMLDKAQPVYAEAELVVSAEMPGRRPSIPNSRPNSRPISRKPL